MCLLCLSSSAGSSTCAYCLLEIDPSEGIFYHSLSCSETQTLARTFSRKDYLQTHLRNDHPTPAPPRNIETWSFAVESYWPRQCGFCGADNYEWSHRMNHVESHFKNGCKVSEWRLPFVADAQSAVTRIWDDLDDNDEEDDDNDHHNHKKHGNDQTPSFSMPPLPADNPQADYLDQCFDFHGYYSLKDFLEMTLEPDRSTLNLRKSLLKKWIRCLVTEVCYLHSMKIAHGNITSSNILVGKADIQLSSCADQRSSVPFLGQDAYSEDIYCLGQVIVEILTSMGGGGQGINNFRHDRRFRLHDANSFSELGTRAGDTSPSLEINDTIGWLKEYDLSFIKKMSSTIPAQRPNARSVCKSLAPLGCCAGRLFGVDDLIGTAHSESASIDVSLPELFRSLFKKSVTSDMEKIDQVNNMAPEITKAPLASTFTLMLQKVPKKSMLKQYVLESSFEHCWAYVGTERPLESVSPDSKDESSKGTTEVCKQSKSRSSFINSVSVPETVHSHSSLFSNHRSVSSDSTVVSAGIECRRKSAKSLAPTMNKPSLAGSEMIEKNDTETETKDHLPSMKSHLPCDFRFSGCQISIHPDQQEDWIEHSLSHFKAHNIVPPVATDCVLPSCQEKICLSEHTSPASHWRARMLHIASHYADGVCVYRTASDTTLLQHLVRYDIISERDFSKIILREQSHFGEGQ